MAVDRRYVGRREAEARAFNATVRATEAAAAEAAFLAVAAFTRAFADTVLRDTRFKQQQLISLAEVFKRGAGSVTRRTQIHRRVAELGADSVRRSYSRIVTPTRRPASVLGYRAGQQRLAGGVLRRALNRPDLIDAGPDGIRFINVTMLDQSARHWHRIAFGAASAGQGSTVDFPITFGNLVIGSVGYSEPPSPGFRIPRGVWVSAEGGVVGAGVNPRGSDAFYPASLARGLDVYRNQRARSRRASISASQQTGGFAGRDFFAAGFRRISVELPRAYEQFYRELFEQFERTGGGVLARNQYPLGLPTR